MSWRWGSDKKYTLPIEKGSLSVAERNIGERYYAFELREFNRYLLVEYFPLRNVLSFHPQFIPARAFRVTNMKDYIHYVPGLPDRIIGGIDLMIEMIEEELNIQS